MSDESDTLANEVDDAPSAVLATRARSCSAEVQLAVDRFVAGKSSGPIAAMELLLATRDFEVATRALEVASGPRGAIDELASLLSAHVAGCSEIASMLRSGVDSWAASSSIEAGIEATRALFDASVSRSEEASVALYSLGSAKLLADATEEVVDMLAGWGVLERHRDALEIGCGIGRLLSPLASRLRSIVGTDISPKMIQAAERRTKAHRNVDVVLSSGRDLSASSSGSFDLVLAVDVLPYVARSGPTLVRCLFEEVRRVLRSGGDFVVFNFAYGAPRADLARDVETLAREAGLAMVRSDETPFRIWNAVGYQLRKDTLF